MKSLYTYGIGRVFELAAEAGFEAIEVLIDHRWDSRHPAYLRRLSEETGLPVQAVHNPYKASVPGWPHDPLSRLRETVTVAQEIGTGVVVTHLPLDTTHLGTWGYDLLDVYERIKARIVHVHLSNYNGLEHRRLEDGHLPLAEFLGCLQRDGFKGAVSLEMGPEALQAEDESQVRRHLQRMVRFCRACFDS